MSLFPSEGHCSGRPRCPTATRPWAHRRLGVCSRFQAFIFLVWVYEPKVCPLTRLRAHRPFPRPGCGWRGRSQRRPRSWSPRPHRPPCERGASCTCPRVTQTFQWPLPSACHVPSSPTREPPQHSAHGYNVFHVCSPKPVGSRQEGS